jgi:hypothetical protein
VAYTAAAAEVRSHVRAGWIFVRIKSIRTPLSMRTTEHIKKRKIHMEIHMCCHVYAGKETSRLLHVMRKREANMLQPGPCMHVIAPRRVNERS